MEIAVIKQEGRRHRAVATTAQGSVQFAVADYPGRLPHDLVHFVVEDTLGLRFGFWGLIAHGAQFEAVVSFAARSPKGLPPVDDPLIAAHVEELLEAERLANTLYSLWGDSPLDGGLSPDLAEAVRHALAEVQEQWNALATGEALHLSWRH
jgi:hypothetical protein